VTTDNGNATSGGAEPTADELVADYLRELESEAARLPWNVRQELMDDMRSHIEVARAENDQSVPERVTVLRILASLGDPGEIVDAAGEGEEPTPPQRDQAPPSNPYGAYGDTPYGSPGYGNPFYTDPMYDDGPPYPLGAQEVWAQILLLFGALLAGIGWIIGLVLLWTSRRWTTRDKVIGTLVIPGGIMGAFMVFGLGAATVSCSGSSNASMVCQGGSSLPGWIGALLAVVIFAAPFLTAIYLRRRAGQVRSEGWGMPAGRSRGGGAVGVGLISGLVLLVVIGAVVAIASTGSKPQPANVGPSMVASPVQAPQPVSSSH
jgi:hypothetical protein